MLLFFTHSVSCFQLPLSLLCLIRRDRREESVFSLHWTTLSLRWKTRWHTQTHTYHHHHAVELSYPLPLFLCSLYNFDLFPPWILLLFLLLTFSFLCECVITFVFGTSFLYLLTNILRFYPLNSFLLHYCCFISLAFYFSLVLCCLNHKSSLLLVQISEWQVLQHLFHVSSVRTVDLAVTLDLSLKP